MARKKQVSFNDLMKSAQMLAITHQLLNCGMFQVQTQKDLQSAIEFITVLHASVMKELEPLIEKEAEKQAKAVQQEVK